MEQTPIERFARLLREELYVALERKTGWGKEELKLEFERSLTNTALKLAAELAEEQ